MSNLVKQSQLKEILQHSWDQTKHRYDGAFKEVELTPNTGTEKKLKFTKVSGGTTVDVDLKDYARLTDQNNFKKDVAADDVAIINNSHIGSNISFDSQNRSLGFRQLTTNSFVDGYVDHIRIYVDNTNANTDSTWTVWAITKDANSKDNDRVGKVICDSKVLEVNSVTEGAETKKFVKIPIEASFALETYFIVRCTTHKLQVMGTVNQEYSNDAINMSTSEPPMQQGQVINWGNGGNVPNNTAIMNLYGRESIGSLALKLKQTQADGSNYVLKTDTTDTGGTGKGGKVVKLDSDGKLNKNMLPSIAINEYFPITAFTDAELQRLTHYENGDVVVVTGATDRGARYLCINKDGENLAHLTDAFIKLNDKAGVVTTVNGGTPDTQGNIAVTATQNGTGITMTFGSNGGRPVEIAAYMTDQEVDEIKRLFT